MYTWASEVIALASRAVRVRANPITIYMTVVAATQPSSSNKSAKQSVVDQLSDLVRLLGADPVSDYGAEKTHVDDDALKHLRGVGEAIEAIASKLFILSDTDANSAAAIAATGFTQYFAQYYCQTHKITARFPNNENLANKCNSQVIAPELQRRLGNVRR
jgi:hypothetical protein